MIYQKLIQEMQQNKDKAKMVTGKLPAGSEYLGSRYYPGYEHAYYKDIKGNYYYKTIDRSNDY